MQSVKNIERKKRLERIGITANSVFPFFLQIRTARSSARVIFGLGTQTLKASLVASLASLHRRDRKRATRSKLFFKGNLLIFSTAALKTSSHWFTTPVHANSKRLHQHLNNFQVKKKHKKVPLKKQVGQKVTKIFSARKNTRVRFFFREKNGSGTCHERTDKCATSSPTEHLKMKRARARARQLFFPSPLSVQSHTCTCVRMCASGRALATRKKNACTYTRM
jgi:hypothetical protein